jgi:hypothetical protein
MLDENVAYHGGHDLINVSIIRGLLNVLEVRLGTQIEFKFGEQKQKKKLNSG